MPQEAAARKKRTVSETANGDHRKRRRNRTTQSCLNCHTSKRMCDRKRPCGRCTHLGLTGVCVYEVDDPSQRSATQDESSRLRQRVAELEGVIRELKNKPNPRWMQSRRNPGEGFEKWHSRAQKLTVTDHISLESRPLSPLSPLSSASSSDKGDAPSIASSSSPSTSNPSRSPIHTPSSLLSTPSPVLTPLEEFSRPLGSDVVDAQDFDLSSIFSSHHVLMAGNETFLGQYDGVLRPDDEKDSLGDELCFMGHSGGQCRCLTDIAGYNAVLDLSIRLRKAVSTLTHSDHHHMGWDCLLYRRIVELDAYTATALGNTTTPVLPVSLRNCGVNSEVTMIHQTANLRGSETGSPVSTICPQSLHRTWNFIQPVSDTSSACDDFMTWET